MEVVLTENLFVLVSAFFVRVIVVVFVLCHVIVVYCFLVLDCSNGVCRRAWSFSQGCGERLR